MLDDLIEIIISFIKGLFSKNGPTTTASKVQYSYTKKNIMTLAEQRFYSLLTEVVDDNYYIWPQINLATVISKNGNSRYQNELYRNVDFGIFSKDGYKLHLLVELNDESHNNVNSRKKRDKNVKTICQSAGINIISFWLNKPNDKEYVRNRINQYLNTADNNVQNIKLDS